MKISNNTEIILKKNRTIQVTEKLSTLNTKILLDFNNKIFVENNRPFEKKIKFDPILKLDDETLFDFSLFTEDIKTKEKVLMARFTLETIFSLRNLSDIKLFTVWIKVYRIESDQDPIVFTFTKEDSNLFDIINVFKHLNLYLKKYGEFI